MNTGQRLSQMRQVMSEAHIDAYIIPSNDPHQSEYVADHWKSREWISGFTGSAGTVVVTNDHAGLWTDSRYFLQAEEQLKSSSFVLHKMYDQFSAGHIDWMKGHLQEGARVGIDPLLFSIIQEEDLQKKLGGAGMHLVYIENIMDKIWSDRPELPRNKIFRHDVRYAGSSRSEKISVIRDQMKTLGADYHLVSTLDDIAWLFNIRGRDVDYNPVVIAYAVIGPNGVVLFIDPAKIDAGLASEFKGDAIEIMDYQSLAGFLNKLPESASILVHKPSTSIAMYRAINARIIPGQLISRDLKSTKNATELKHVKDAMVKDGVALVRAFMWLENELKTRTVSELEFSDKLAECRATQDGYYGESFGAIIGYRGNGAIIHYRPEKETCAQILPEGILLADSGGQYVNGTTDITRTIALSPPTERQKEAYTRVLKGHIALACAIYPKGTIGGQLDVLARKPLWDAGLNYLHGTGHGVGFFLNVHEPPQGFTAGLSSRSNTVLKPGMITSNEPGHYVTGEYGMRIENLIVTVESDKEGFYAHETITYFPIDTTLISRKLMSDEEIAWLNAYHVMVRNRLSPNLDTKEIEWLEQKCRPI